MKTINKTAITLVATGVIGLGAIGATVIPAMAKHHGENYGDKQAKFAEMDTNGDGAVSLDELTANATAKIQEKFTKMDANGDGQVTEDELTSRKGKGKKGKHGGKYGGKHGGKYGGKHGGKYGGKHGGKYGGIMSFDSLDANDDGTVALDELTAYAQEIFTKMDANGDGQITEDELKSGKRKGKYSHDK